jgi:hypothetical protein
LALLFRGHFRVRVPDPLLLAYCGLFDSLR